MITLILPGYSSKNKKWVNEVANSLKIDGDIRPISWDHWTDLSKKFNPVEKARILSDISQNKVINIIAKSMGTLVAAYIVEKIPMQIGKIILCGIPPRDLGEGGIKLVRNLPSEKTVIFQNDKDPLGACSEIKKLLPNFKLIEKNGDTHDYPYFEDFNNYLTS